MTSLPVPPPPPPKATPAAGPSARCESGPFTRTGNTADETSFEFPDSTSERGSVSLKAIVRQYAGTSHSRSVPAKQLYMILGRLRCLNYAISKYNEGVLSPDPSFLQYWQRRTLNQLSGFGFQVQSVHQSITIAGLSELIHSVEEVFAHDISAAHELIKGKLVTFDALGELYSHDRAVQGKTSLGGSAGVFLVTEYYFEEHRSLVGMEKSFHITMDFVATMGQHFTVVSFTEVLSGWMGVRARPLSDLTYIPVDPSDYDDLVSRGERYTRFGTGGAQFLAYRPSSFSLHFSGKGGASSSLSRFNLIT